ncbi:TRAM/LAG1/CLN8 homology domain,TRAM1-like protein [Cinara cedri]|uniref:TRAM/LAG1/CLN8 homology domain,TRAM1-like protein n=1 Tax=Cinara cedri TaxID=506608 RepID=A0A5E4M3E3_9HEMI|nr:TRAM/LAG1/CLN8 homology domain,TRAM1-like protein [Cinara cedri]
MAPTKGRKSAANKNSPMLSHDFVIQNHADIVSCVAMLLVIGLMVQFTSPISSLFVALQYGQTSDPNTNVVYTYGTGPKDLCAVFFYFLICIIFHAIIQEYVLDKISRKLHLSKSKNSKFNEIGQLVIFYTISIIWALDIIVKGNWITDVTLLWVGYPNYILSFSIKFFYIIQFAYWAHNFPELYFQKVKKEDMFNRVKYSVLYLAYISFVYITNFHRTGLVVLLLYYISVFVKLGVTLVDITEKEEDSPKVKFAQKVYHWVFSLVQISILLLSQYMWWFGLKFVHYTGGARDFNYGTFKLVCSIGSLTVQALILNELCNELKFTGITITIPPRIMKLLPKSKSRIDNANKKRKITSNRKFNELTEADQNIKKTLKTAAKKAAKTKGSK